MLSLFYNIIDTLKSCYRRKNIVYQFLVILLTYVLVVSGFDYWYFEKTYHIGMYTFFFLPALIGFFVPVCLPLCLLAIGHVKKNFYLKNTAWALGQAAMLGLVISSIYKVFTGRVPHNFRGLTGVFIDTSHKFQFGFYRGGAFTGWPSSHTTVAFAMAGTLVMLYPKDNITHKCIRYISIIYAFYIGIGVSTNIHWFSDFAAGAILGTIIGLAVGKSFFARFQN